MVENLFGGFRADKRVSSSVEVLAMLSVKPIIYWLESEN
jgi:hypothetical protein